MKSTFILAAVLTVTAQLPISYWPPNLWAPNFWASGLCWAQAVPAADQMDAARAKRYVSRLQSLQEARQRMRDRAASLMAQNPDLEQELLAAMRTQMIAAGVLDATPEVIATPQLLQTFRSYRGQSGEIILVPELLLWYAFQDNTLIRQQIFLTVAGAQRDANQTYATLESSRVALQQLSENADGNFLEFRQLSDVMGRRSLQELTDAEALTARWSQDDPMHAGAALVRAYALRATGRFDECTQVLELLDNNFPAMQSIANTIAAQIALVGGNVADAERLLDKAMAQARQAGTAEAYLVAGWLALSQQKWATAKSHASRARQLNPGNVEVAILEALAITYERSGRAREGLQLLRRAQLNKSPDDWHYHEALAIVHMTAKDFQFAKREIATAVSVAPSHIRAELEREQQEIANGKVPQIDWPARLVMQWVR
ncbi:MAG: hypothetical protein IT423_02660 [Pirellulaceae bacterium]|nr:hypothetical protein [Pirellulaceae bacterium]